MTQNKWKMTQNNNRAKKNKQKHPTDAEIEMFKLLFEAISEFAEETGTVTCTSYYDTGFTDIIEGFAEDKPEWKEQIEKIYMFHENIMEMQAEADPDMPVIGFIECDTAEEFYQELKELVLDVHSRDLEDMEEVQIYIADTHRQVNACLVLLATFFIHEHIHKHLLELHNTEDAKQAHHALPCGHSFVTIEGQEIHYCPVCGQKVD